MRRLLQWVTLAGLLSNLALCSGCGSGGGPSTSPGPGGAGRLAMTILFPPPFTGRSAASPNPLLSKDRAQASSNVTRGVGYGAASSPTGHSAAAGRRQSSSVSRQTASSTGSLPIGTNAVKVDLSDPGTGSALAPSQIVARPSGSDTAQVLFPSIPVGSVLVTATAYADTAATEVMATGSASGTVTANTTTSINVPVTLVPVGQVTITPAAPSAIQVGGVLTLTGAVLSPATPPAPLPGFPLAWTSSDSTIASVTPDSTNPLTAVVQGLSAGQATITATEPNTGKSTQVTVTVNPIPPIQVALSPTQATVSSSSPAPVTFTATVTGTANTGVLWSIQEGSRGGQLTVMGNMATYLAPPIPGTYHVVATSVVDTTKSAFATVTVTSP